MFKQLEMKSPFLPSILSVVVCRPVRAGLSASGAQGDTDMKVLSARIRVCLKTVSPVLNKKKVSIYKTSLYI